MNASNNNSVRKSNLSGNTNGFDVRDILFFLWRLRYWIIGSCFIAFCIAYLYVKAQTPIYERRTQVILTNDRSNKGGISMLSDIAGMEQTSKIDNEIFIFRSKNLMKKVVEELSLNIRYYVNQTPTFKLTRPSLNFRKQEFYKDNPFAVEVSFDSFYSEKSRPRAFAFELTPISEDTFKIMFRGEEETELTNNATYSYGDKIAFKGFTVVVSKIITDGISIGSHYEVTWADPAICAATYVDSLHASIEMSPSSRMSSRTDVISLVFRDSKTERAEDVLSTLVQQYNEESRFYQNAAVLNSIKFMDSRLADIAHELGMVETSYQQYQSSRALVNIEAQSQMALSSDQEYEKQLNDIRLQQNILKMIKSDLDKMSVENYDVIPSNIGLADANLNLAINTYNQQVAERNRMVANSSPNNPRVQNMNLVLKDGRNSIIASIDNLGKVYGLREGEINRVLQKNKAAISTIPTQQYDLTQIERKQKIIEPLFTLLQQKREEAQISMYNVPDNARIIEPPYGSNAPILPKTMSVLLVAMFLGFCFPPALAWLLGILRTTIQSEEDIEKVLSETVLANIPKFEDGSVIRKSSSRDIKTESFRMLRSNLKFLEGKVIQVTSSAPGEGKSSIASNLAVSLSHTKKRVALLGLDLRKPSLHKYFPSLHSHTKYSIIGYFIDKCDVSEMFQEIEGLPYLHVAVAGVVAPNPTELLSSSDKLKEMIDYCRADFDYVICDSAPMMPVADSLLINKFVDRTLYVVRAEFTALKILPKIRTLFEKADIVKPNMLLNGLNLRSNTFKYGYGKGYGYYGYYGGYYGKGYGHG
ncbi:MAG: polysaccharide biosynthesis tyrosine autokinase, partial [Bacteroidales bacterium]|nr:polysaccharide biosynthesis tyrosine autokinase [Bacteroidales bacterium]